MQATEKLVRNVVEQVLTRWHVPRRRSAAMGFRAAMAFLTMWTSGRRRPRGLRATLRRTVEDRKRIIDHIRRISIDQ